jgi:hypothetical protein
MGSSPDTTLGPRVFGADYFSNKQEDEAIFINKVLLFSKTEVRKFHEREREHLCFRCSLLL